MCRASIPLMDPHKTCVCVRQQPPSVVGHVHIDSPYCNKCSGVWIPNKSNTRIFRRGDEHSRNAGCTILASSCGHAAQPLANHTNAPSTSRSDAKSGCLSRTPDHNQMRVSNYTWMCTSCSMVTSQTIAVIYASLVKRRKV